MNAAGPSGLVASRAYAHWFHRTVINGQRVRKQLPPPGHRKMDSDNSMVKAWVQGGNEEKGG